MELSKKVAYLKGLMEGLKIDDSTNEGKILTIMADILDDMSGRGSRRDRRAYLR